MGFITADRIHDGHKWLPDRTVIEVGEDGEILAVIDGPVNDAVHYEGVICPGFVNVHCHLELSHLHGLVPEHTRLIPFLRSIPRHRNDFTAEQKLEARYQALNDLVSNGVVAVGDIANTAETLGLRAEGKLHFHTFIESIGFIEANAKRSFGFSEATFNEFQAQELSGKIQRQSITPHAPYSVSKALFGLIDCHLEGSLVSIHNQESKEENKFYERKEGAVRELLAGLGIDDSLFEPTGKTSLQSYGGWLLPMHPLILVHNTYSTQEDVVFANSGRNSVYWCLCPNANMYIENTLPDVPMLMANDCMICIGTDSLASNHQLCILSELYTLKEHFPNLSWETLLNWGTYNGAKALQMDNEIGSVEPGKHPGLLLINGLVSGVRPTVTRIA